MKTPTYGTELWNTKVVKDLQTVKTDEFGNRNVEKGWKCGSDIQ